jgi:hypothetical protein
VLYKVLYLPLGEEILISVHYMGPYIPSGVRARESSIGLKAPGTPTKGAKFKRALFSDKSTATAWITDLIERGSLRDANLRMEHFEIVDINRD